jgi:hypothetical protein
MNRRVGRFGEIALKVAVTQPEPLYFALLPHFAFEGLAYSVLTAEDAERERGVKVIHLRTLTPLCALKRKPAACA